MFSDWVGVPYKHLGRDKTGVDCWGLIVCLFGERGINVLDVDYVEDSRERGDIFSDKYYDDWQSVDEIKPWDVLLFEYRDKATASHAGIYLGKGKFIHAGKMGVVIDRLSRWQGKLKGAYRHKGIAND